MENPQDSDVSTTTQRIVEAALELKAEQIVSLDMRGVSSLADVFLITSGRSGRHVRSIAESIIQTLRTDDREPLGVEGLSEGRWVLIDADDIVVHVFEEEMREIFDLERLWSDAPSLDFSPANASAG